jgi:hypothetical protein
VAGNIGAGMIFFVGLHHPNHAAHFDECFISVNRLRDRKSDFQVKDWIMDSGAFTEISTYGGYRCNVDEYISQIERWRYVGNMRAAVTQDWMCEPFIIQKTGYTVLEHQKLTITRYDQICERTDCCIMPVLQGYEIGDYLDHLDMYGDRLTPGMWVGVGSICKRNSDVAQIEDILDAIRSMSCGLRLHGFGIKTTALQSASVTDALYSADSMAWSFAARRDGRNANCWKEAERFRMAIERKPKQLSFYL